MNTFRLFGSLRRVALAIAILCLVSSCVYSDGGANTILNGDLKYTQEELRMKPFTEIEIQTVANVYYTQNNGSKHQVSLDFSKISDPDFKQKMKDKVKVVYRDGKMIVGLSDRVKGISKLKGNERLCVYVTSPDLVKVDLGGVGSFNSETINSDVFKMDNEGVGNINIQNLLANKIEITNEGVGSVRIGNVQSDHVDIDNEGVGNVVLSQFKGGLLSIDNEGVGKVEAHVDCQAVDATLEGVGNIKLSGVTRKLSKEKDGVGSFKISDLKVLK